MPELSLYELEMERAELLPARETLQVLLVSSPLSNTATNTALSLAGGGNGAAGAAALLPGLPGAGGNANAIASTGAFQLNSLGGGG